MEVELKVDLRSCRDVTACAVAEYVRTLSNCILIKKDTLLCYLKLDVSVHRAAMVARVTGFYHGCSDVVDILIALGRNNLNCLDEAVLSQTGINLDVRPPIGSFGLHDQVFWKTDNEIRLADLPRMLIRKSARRWHVGEISPRSANVHPLHNRCDLLVGQ